MCDLFKNPIIGAWSVNDNEFICEVDDISQPNQLLDKCCKFGYFKWYRNELFYRFIERCFAYKSFERLGDHPVMQSRINDYPKWSRYARYLGDQT